MSQISHFNLIFQKSFKKFQTLLFHLKRNSNSIQNNYGQEFEAKSDKLKMWKLKKQKWK